MRHFLITLFNLQLWPHDKSRTSTRTRRWLDSRISLFEKFCLPSVAAQTSKDFIWLVMFDRDTPSEVRKRIEQWKQLCPTLHPCFFSAEEVEGFINGSTDRRVDFITDTIRTFLKCDEKWIITTNLDNDDSLATNAIERIAAAAKRSPALKVISLVHGLQMFPRAGAVMDMTYPHNHFLSLCEPLQHGKQIITIESISHRMARRKFNVEDLKDEPGWIEVVHDSNISNDLRITSRIKYRPVLHDVNLAAFGINRTIPRAVQIKGTIAIAGYFFKVAARRLHKKLSRK